MKQFLKTLWYCVWPVLLYFLIELIVSGGCVFALAGYNFVISGDLVLDEINALVSKYTVEITGLLSLVMIPVLIAIYNADTRENVIVEKRMPVNSFLTVLLSVLGIIGLAIVGNILISISGLAMYDASFQEVNEVLANMNIFSALFVATLIGPICEELLFRAVVMRRLQYSFGPIPAIIISGIGFGAFHGNLTQGIYAGLLGIMFGYVYYKTERIYIPIIGHVLANFCTLLSEAFLLMLPTSNIIAGDAIVNGLLFIIGALLTTISIIYLAHYECEYRSVKDGL